MEDAGLWGGIWQNTCSKLTKTSVQLLFTAASNSCKNVRFLRVFCVVQSSTTAVWEVRKLSREVDVRLGTARQKLLASTEPITSEREGTQTCWSRPEPVATHSEDAVTFRMSYLESAATGDSAPGLKIRQHTLRRRSDPGVCRGVNGDHVASGRTCAHK